MENVEKKEEVTIEKSLEHAIRRAVIDDDIESLLPAIQLLSEEKKQLCRKIFLEEKERRKKLVHDGLIKDE